MKSFIYSFEKLDVWQRSIDLAASVYTATEKFPKSEQFGLTMQMRRCSVSVSSNLAEGSARHTPKDQAHFTTISFGSLMELLNQIIIAEKLKFIEESSVSTLRTSINEISVRLTGLRKSQLDKI